MRNIVQMRPEVQTVLAIAHRLSSIKDADMIIVGKDGTIKEMGIARAGEYSKWLFCKFRLARISMVLLEVLRKFVKAKMM